MHILFDHGVPAPLRTYLAGRIVITAKQRGWDTYLNGELLNAAEAAGFESLHHDRQENALSAGSSEPQDGDHRVG